MTSLAVVMNRVIQSYLMEDTKGMNSNCSCWSGCLLLGVGHCFYFCGSDDSFGNAGVVHRYASLIIS